MLVPCLTACSGLLGLDDKEFVDPPSGAGQGGAAGSGGQPVSGASGQTASGAAGSPAGAGQGGAGQGGAGQAGSSAGGGTGGAAGDAAAGASGQSGGGQGPGGDGGAAGAGQQGCGEIYVAVDGDDAADGCKESPRKTIGKALELVSTGRSEVRVCVGTYSETLSIDADVTIVGGFECGSWASKLPAPEGIVLADADELLTTSIVNSTKSLIGNADPRARTLVVKGNRQVTLRGLRITGHLSSQASSWAVDASAQGSTLTVDRCLLEGGGGQNTLPGGMGSIGLEVGAQTGVTISHSAIRGGTGVGDALGSLAMGVAKGTGDEAHLVTVDQSLLDGGTGRANGSANAGAQGSGALATQSPVRVWSSELHGGGGSVVRGISSAAMVASAAATDSLLSIDVSDSYLAGGTGTMRVKESKDALGVSYGLLGTHIKGLVTRSRLYGGDPRADAASATRPIASAMEVGQGSDVTLTNNVLVGGNQAKPIATTSGMARALVVTTQSQVSLLHSTLLGGTTDSSGTQPVALHVGPGGMLARFENNLLGTSSVQASVENSYNIFIEGCPQGRFGTFVGNAFLPAIAPLISYYSGSGLCLGLGQPSGSFFTFKAMQEAGIAPSFPQNKLITATCSTDAAKECLNVPGCGAGQGSTCQVSLLGADVSQVQLGQPFTSLPVSLPCAFAQLDGLLPDVLTDAREKGRRDKTTPGAVEYDSCK